MQVCEKYKTSEKYLPLHISETKSVLLLTRSNMRVLEKYLDDKNRITDSDI